MREPVTTISPPCEGSAAAVAGAWEISGGGCVL
jgi:hypothetical protein